MLPLLAFNISQACDHQHFDAAGNINHVLSDATEDHVQESAAMEAGPTTGDVLERVINEDNLGEIGWLQRTR